MTEDGISDEEWAFYKPFLTPARKRGKGPRNQRLVLDAILWIASFRTPWRALPKRFGNWTTAHSQFRRWSRGRVWETMLRDLPASDLPPHTLAQVEASISRAMNHHRGGPGLNRSTQSRKPDFVYHRLSDKEWTFLKAFLVGSSGSRGRPARDHRLVLDGALWIASSECPWRELPSCFGSWKSVHRQFLRWSTLESWDLILNALPSPYGDDDQEAQRPSCSISTVSRDKEGELRDIVFKLRTLACRPKSRSRRSELYA
jgi:transposase